MRRIILDIPSPTPLQNVWQRMHWAKRKRVCEYWSWLVKEALMNLRPSEPVGLPIEKCIVHITRYSAGEPDIDNLYGGVKPLMDALVVCTKRNPHGLGVIRDDNQKVVTNLKVDPKKAKRGEGRTHVVIQEIA
jgi:Holliday junction resolvase RusA-like endonuclease